jgi:hypothetical protein
VTTRNPTEQPTVPLLTQAEQHLLRCQKAEAAARRLWPQTAASAEAIRRAQQEHLAARSQLERLQRSLAHLQTDLPGARTNLRRAEGAWAEAKEQARRAMIRARAQYETAAAEVRRLEWELANIAGPDAVPTET